MAFFVSELISTLEAAVILFTILAGAGALFGRLLSFPGIGSASAGQRLGISLLSGIACLPILLDFAGRLGPMPMVATAVATALLGLPTLVNDLRSLGLKAFVIGFASVLIWCLFIGFMLVDMPGRTGLLHSYLVLDYVKHTSATWSIASIGTPPWNPAAYEPGKHAAYYYLFYCLTAVTSLIGSAINIEARHAAFAGAACIGVALFALTLLIWHRAGLDSMPDVQTKTVRAQGSATFLLIMLLCTTGLDLIPASLIASFRGSFQSDPEHWNTEVTSWLSSILWVPHHMAALCAAMMGLIALATPGDRNEFPDWRSVVFAGLAFASMAGMSVYVGLGGALTAIVWTVTLLFRRKIKFAFRVALAGSLALVVAVPWIQTLAGVANLSEPPVAIHIRPFSIADIFVTTEPLRSLVNFLLLPLSYGLEFGVFALGSIVFWKKFGRDALPTELANILLIGALISFVVGSFFASTIINNDLGWRIMLFAQLATLIWTASLIRHDSQLGHKPGALLLACIVLGYGFNLLTVYQLRFNAASTSLQSPYLADEISAWQWLDRTLPKGSVVQQRPDGLRATDFAFYGHFPTALADQENARLYGASMPLIRERLEVLLPIFTDPTLRLKEVRVRCASFGIRALIVTSSDPVFDNHKAWTYRLTPAYANAHVKVFLMQVSMIANEAKVQG